MSTFEITNLVISAVGVAFAAMSYFKNNKKNPPNKNSGSNKSSSTSDEEVELTC